MAQFTAVPSAGIDKSIQDITNEISKMSLLSFRAIGDVKKLARHFRNVINHPMTQENVVVAKYLRNLDQMHRRIYTQTTWDGVQVEYIFTPETKSSLQRQRFNSLPVSEVSQLLKTEFPSSEKSVQVHICTDCNVAIEQGDEEPLMESLQKHFNLEVHLPKLKRESIDVAETIVLPNMSRRLSSMGGGTNANVESIVHLIKPIEKLDRLFLAKLEASLIRHLPDNSESNINSGVKFYQGVYDKLCQEVSEVNFAMLTGSVAPIIMSIKDNVNQNFATDANKNFETEDPDQITGDRPAKNPIKKHRYYGPMETIILKLLINHKLLPLVDDRTGKPAFFCIACEYYTLRFRYDSVLNHVFSESHIHNLTCVLLADRHVVFINEERSIEKIKEMNQKFLLCNGVGKFGATVTCNLCNVNIDSQEASILHVLDENHLCKMSDKLYKQFRSNNPVSQIPEDWGQRNLDWAKYLAGTSKALSNKDNVVIENFIRPSGKLVNFCPCCDTTLKGPRQILFNHIRQKKHLRNCAPLKLSLLYKNYCRPVEYYAGFGNFYMCAICPNYVAFPSFAGIVEHIESDIHMEILAKFIGAAINNDEKTYHELLSKNKINTMGGLKCDICMVSFPDIHDAVFHALSSVDHHNMIADNKHQQIKGDIISVYMKGNYILHSEGSSFTCIVCNGVFNSLRSLLTHLMYASHFNEKPSSESVFRFYLELKHNINLLVRNKYIYTEFGKLKCGVCDFYLEYNENAKKHVGTARHRENMGANYVNVNMDVSATD